MTTDPRWSLPAFLDRLTELHLSYTIGRYRDSINVMVATPGDRWEVEFMDDGTIQVERFRSSGEMGDERWFDELFAAVE
jgi:hypothetical protein